MGPELGMHKVEFLGFFLLIALFRTAQFLSYPSQQFNMTSKIYQNVTQSIPTIIMGAMSLTFKMDAFLDRIISNSILATCSLLHWIFRDGLMIVLYFWLAFFSWIRTSFRYICLSWQWLIVFISGTWNAPDSCPLRQIFIDPGWHYVLPPHLRQPIDRDYFRRLNYNLQEIHVRQAREFWKI